MTIHPDDRPDPLEQPIRARVPEKVAGGCFSTGVIVMTAQTEFVLDFVQNLGRPHQIVARVVMPHSVLPQLVDALGRNMQLYKGRWGDLPQPPQSASVQIAGWGKPVDSFQTGGTGPTGSQGNPSAPTVDSGSSQTGAPTNTDSVSKTNDVLGGSTPNSSTTQRSETDAGSETTGGTETPLETVSESNQGATQQPPTTSPDGASSSESHPPVTSGTPATPNTPFQPVNSGQGVRQATAQEIYDDLKIRDELLSGVYANAVMIGHGPHEFSFDFITNFYPNSAVSARVFMAAGQIPRLYDSLRGTWEQLRLRMQPPPENPPPGWVV